VWSTCTKCGDKMVMDVNCEIGLDELVRDNSFRVIHHISKQRQMPSVGVGYVARV